MKRRIVALEEELRELDKNRMTMRAARDRSRHQKIAIVGYTNAGKSTLLNRLTDAGILAEDKLFATLDPTTRKFELPCGESVLLTDTVGFINKLPHGDMSNSSVAEFVVWLLFSHSQRTVRENASYPQYLKYNKYGALKAASAVDENELFAGDVNSDGNVTAADARLALRISVGLENVSKETKLLADVDGNGTVTAADARLILRYSVGLENSFPVNK